MAEPDASKLTEIDLETDQRARLMTLFSCVETYDGREAVITFCETQIGLQRED